MAIDELDKELDQLEEQIEFRLDRIRYFTKMLNDAPRMLEKLRNELSELEAKHRDLTQRYYKEV
jgi:chromosome segregation ATPase